MNEILVGDAAARLREIPEASVNCCVTSPPYWGLRDYGVDGQIGLEKTPAEFIERLVSVFREVRRVLRDDGTAWVNMGDTYAGSWGAQGRQGHGEMTSRSIVSARQIAAAAKKKSGTGSVVGLDGLKAKDLVGIPWTLALALRDDGWWLRSDIIWAKPNPMPESILDRPTKSHEYIFLLSKSDRYYYDADAIRERASEASADRYKYAFSGCPEGSTIVPGDKDGQRTRPKGMRKARPLEGAHGTRGHDGNGMRMEEKWDNPMGRNKRTVWTVPTIPFEEAHFATFPEQLIQPCILAGSPAGGVVLDPFMGAGTTALVALKAGRRFMGVELNPEYAEMARRRIEPELTQLRLA